MQPYFIHSTKKDTTKHPPERHAYNTNTACQIPFFLCGGNPCGHQATSGGGGSAGLQPTKTSTMTDPAAIKRGPGTAARDTPGPSRAQNASSPEPPYKAIGFPYRTAWRSRRADLSAPNFDPHRGKRRPWSALSKRARGVCHAPADRSSRGGNSAPSLFPIASFRSITSSKKVTALLPLSLANSAARIACGERSHPISAMRSRHSRAHTGQNSNVCCAESTLASQWLQRGVASFLIRCKYSPKHPCPVSTCVTL